MSAAALRGRTVLMVVVALAALASAAQSFNRSLIPSAPHGRVTYVTEYGDTGGRVQSVQLDGRRWVEADRSAIDGVEHGVTVGKQRWSTTLETSDGPRELRPSSEVWWFLVLAVAAPLAVWWGARPPDDAVSHPRPQGPQSSKR